MHFIDGWPICLDVGKECFSKFNDIVANRGAEGFLRDEASAGWPEGEVFLRVFSIFHSRILSFWLYRLTCPWGTCAAGSCPSAAKTPFRSAAQWFRWAMGQLMIFSHRGCASLHHYAWSDLEAGFYGGFQWEQTAEHSRDRSSLPQSPQRDWPWSLFPIIISSFTTLARHSTAFSLENLYC